MPEINIRPGTDLTAGDFCTAAVYFCRNRGSLAIETVAFTDGRDDVRYFCASAGEKGEGVLWWKKIQKKSVHLLRKISRI